VISVLIVSYNTRDLTQEAIASVIDEPQVETIVVDNASSDDSAEAIGRRFPTARVIRAETNLGFAAGVNRAASVACGDYLLVLNPDARLEPNALKRMLELMDQQPRAGLVSPALQYPDGRQQSAAFSFPGLVQVLLDLFPIARLAESRLNGRVHVSRPTRIDHPLGACMLIRGAAWQDVGPLEEGYFMYLEEIDWCRRAQRRGWQIWQQPGASVIHVGGASTSQQPDAMFAQLWRSRLRYYARFHGPLFNRLVHSIVRAGLRHKSGAIERVRDLVA
jgi:GT2 family glycosyltransferase